MTGTRNLVALAGALETYKRYYPSAGMPGSDVELSHRIDSLPRSAATELRRLAAEGGLELVRRAFKAMPEGSTSTAADALRVEVFAGRLRPPGATVRNHPSQLVVKPKSEVIRSAPPELPRDARTASEITSWLASHGFEEKGQKGSHQQWVGPTGHKVTVPMHRGDIPPGTLSSIRRQIASALTTED